MRIQEAFKDLHPVHRLRQDLPLQLTVEQCSSLKNLYLKTDLGIVDCLGEILGVGDFDTVFSLSVEIELPVGKCRVLDIDALIRSKQAMNRDRDIQAIAQLKAIKEKQSQQRKIQS